jgi:hypothetical protein
MHLASPHRHAAGRRGRQQEGRPSVLSRDSLADRPPPPYPRPVAVGVVLEVPRLDAAPVVRLAPDVAYTIRAVTGVATDTAGNTRPEIRSVETIAWLKRNGEWKVMAGHESLQKQSWPAWLAFEASQ